MVEQIEEKNDDTYIVSVNVSKQLVELEQMGFFSDKRILSDLNHVKQVLVNVASKKFQTLRLGDFVGVKSANILSFEEFKAMMNKNKAAGI